MRLRSNEGEVINVGNVVLEEDEKGYCHICLGGFFYFLGKITEDPITHIVEKVGGCRGAKLIKIEE